MAAAASCSSFAVTPSTKYDVFISFRGEDARRNIISHLSAALRRAKINFYIDERIKKGDEVWPELVDAINNSYLCIVVFSKRYASSTWCLRELTHILECKKEKQVIPVFYQIDPSDIRKQNGNYKKAFRKYEKDSKLDEKTVQKWKSSLEKAVNFSGFDSESKDYRDEYQFIEKIVRDVSQKLDCIYPRSEARGLVGIDNNCACVEALLREVQTIGLWGMGGIGKTTVARVVFAKYYSQYEGHCFLANIREKSGKHEQGLYDLRNELFSKLLEEESSHIGALNMESTFVKYRLRRKNVFIVLDDVDTTKQFEYLVGETNCFGPDSKIIVTTRNKDVLRGRVDAVHKVEELNFKDSLQLFKMKAFEKDHSQMDFDELSKMVVIYCKGIPLVLEVLGSFLHSRRKETWQSTLRKLKKCPHERIQNALKLSYDGLDGELKELFLDIAFFFKGHKKDEIEKFLDACDFEAAFGMEILQDKALISISDCNTVEMHDLIQEMGWQIVHQECKDPKGRSRLRDPKEAYNVLKKGSDVVQGMILDVSQIIDLHLSGDTLKRMTNLRLLKFYCPYHWYGRACKVHIPSALGLFSDYVRCFYGNAYFLESLSSTSCLEKLVEFHIPHTHIRKLWDEVQDIVNLKRMNFERSKQLMELPGFSKELNMESIDLSDCQTSCHVQIPLYDKSLLELSMRNNHIKKPHDRLQDEVNLKGMDVSGFKRLMELANLSIVSDPDSVYLSGCKNWCDVHPFILYLHMFVKLDLSWCVKLKKVQDDEIHLTSLKDLFDQDCLSLKEFSLTSVEIKELDISDTSTEALPSSIKGLFLFDLIQNAPMEPSNISHQYSQIIFDALRSLERQLLCDFCKLSQIPNNVSFLSSLNELVLHPSHVESLSATIKQLSANIVPKWSKYRITEASIGIGICRPSKYLRSVENICSGIPQFHNSNEIKFGVGIGDRGKRRYELHADKHDAGAETLTENIDQIKSEKKIWNQLFY